MIKPTPNTTPWSRTMAYIKDWEARQNNDGGAGPFSPKPHDVRQLLQENTEMLGILIYWMPYIEGHFEARDEEHDRQIDRLREFLKTQKQG